MKLCLEKIPFCHPQLNTMVGIGKLQIGHLQKQKKNPKNPKFSKLKILIFDR